MTEYHNPVLLHPSVDAVVTNPDGLYVDATFGGCSPSTATRKPLRRPLTTRASH